MYASVVRGDDAVTVGLAGNDEILWVFQRRPEPDGTLWLRFAYRSHDARPPVQFVPLGLAPVVGGIRHAVVLDRGLHVMYRDGTHKKYRPSSFVSDPWSSSTQSDERVLPQSETPLALAADEAAPCLYALVSARCGLELATVPPDGERLPPDEPTVMMIRGVLPTGTTTIARFAEGRWTLDRDGPAELANRGTSCVLLARMGELHLFCPGEDGTIEHRQSPSAAEVWSAPEPLPLGQPPVKLVAGWRDDQPTILYVDRVDSHLQVSLLSRHQGRWTKGSTLQGASGEPARFLHPIGLTWFRSEPAIASLDAEANVQVGLWSFATGELLEAPTVVTPLSRQAAPRSQGLGGLLIQYVVLGALLTGIFLWRRDSLLVVPPLSPEHQLPAFAKRLAAVLIDLTILFPVWGPLLFMMILSEGGGSLPWLMNSGPESAPPPGLVWFRPVLGAVYALYGAILEGIFGATFGKRVTGLCVVDYRGQRGRFAVILIRNLARILEFNYPPLCLLVLMTPARQRIGDILAQTVVLSQEQDQLQPPLPGG